MNGYKMYRASLIGGEFERYSLKKWRLEEIEYNGEKLGSIETSDDGVYWWLIVDGRTQKEARISAQVCAESSRLINF